MLFICVKVSMALSLMTLCSFITYISFLTKTSLSIKLRHVYLAKIWLSSQTILTQNSVTTARQIKLFNLSGIVFP